MCPCHYSVEELKKLVQAIIRLTPALGIAKSTVDPPKQSTGLVAYSCGHEFMPEKKLSSMALAYVKTNLCDLCKEERVDNGKEAANCR